MFYEKKHFWFLFGSFSSILFVSLVARQYSKPKSKTFQNYSYVQNFNSLMSQNNVVICPLINTDEVVKPFGNYLPVIDITSCIRFLRFRVKSA